VNGIEDHEHFESALKDMLDGGYDDDPTPWYTIDCLSDVSTFEEAGVMTMERGLVVRLTNGAEFQITIVQSARARGDDQGPTT
jgi:hypothetical protein